MNFEQAFFDELVKIAVEPSSSFYNPRLLKGLGVLGRLGRHLSGETSIPTGTSSPAMATAREEAGARGRNPLSVAAGGAVRAVRRAAIGGAARKRIEALVNEPRATALSAVGGDVPA